MRIISKTGKDDAAVIYAAEAAGGNLVEFVESLQNPLPRFEKWILTVSTLYGCPVNCNMCDAGSYYLGRISKEGIFWQIDYMISKRFPDGNVPVKKLKVNFTRMGEPAFNMNVLDVINEFRYYFNAPGFFPSISTIAPNGSEKFLEELLVIKNNKFNKGNFQLQFSIHTTDEAERNRLMPVKKWSLGKIAEFGSRFFRKGDRKITLSFAPAEEYSIDPGIIQEFFDPEYFLIKLTQLNITGNTIKNKLTPVLTWNNTESVQHLSDNFKKAGYDVIVNLSGYEEIIIGSTCGQNILSQFNKEK